MYEIKLCVYDFKNYKYIYNLNLDDKLEKLANLFKLNKKVRVYFLESYKEYFSILGFNVPSWVTGISVDNNILLYVEGKDSLYARKLMIHELVHVLVNHTAKDRCPTWLNEALAIYISEQHYDFNLKNIKMLDEDDEEYGDFYYEKCYLKLKDMMEQYSLEQIIDALRSNAVNILA